MGLGPEFLVAIFVKEGDGLHSRPAENGIVANKWCDIAVGDSVFNSGVDQVGKEGDTKRN